MEEVLSSEQEFEPEHRQRGPLKRRKLTQDEISGTFADSQRDADSVNKSTRQPPRKDKENNDPDAPKTKKPKHRIHVPNNPSMPEDTFLTQPPSRSPSPYRIDKFCWQKPRRLSEPVPTGARAHQSIETSHISPRPTVRTPSKFRAADPFRKPFTGIPPSQASNDSYERTAEATGEFPPTSTFDVPDAEYENVLDDLPSDAFSSPEPSAKGGSDEPIEISSQDRGAQEESYQFQQHQRLAAPLANLRQTTLFGTQVQNATSQTQSVRKRNWPLANREEPPTHHQLDKEALETWVYPTNLGKIRDYQYSIVARGLYNNMLVALPTGLGKTFIAATIMLNWFRWTKDAQIVFVAPTRPLVSQQIKACFEIAGIPRSATTMLTGNTPPGVRAEEWRSKRVFFMTPQTIENDLKTGICDPKKVVLLVVDEAHRATGGYAYVTVVTFLRRFNQSFRVLALTATPGASIEGVQEVIDGLGISRIEIRTEDSIDIQEYVHSRKVETIFFDNSDEMTMVMDLFAKALQPLVDKLCGLNAYWGRDPMSLTPYGCNQARNRWVSSDVGRKASMGVKGMINSVFSLLASLAHGIELLKFHGIGPFYHKVLAFRTETREAGNKGSKYRKQVDESDYFQKMMSRVQVWINNPDFIGHPKLEYLQSVVLNHFLDAGEGRGASGPSGTRIMVFAHYRDSAEEIARILKRNEPMIRPRVFVGQANSKGSEGMDQKSQLDVIQKFQTGIYNTLVATSIGEEGLDIGEVDLIICYDASASPIRMLQRMGRTGRKRAGNIVVTLMRGKEENNFIKAKDNYEKMQREIAAGTRFTFRDDQSRRIVPRDVQPVVDKRVVDIPFENTQADLPEPPKRTINPRRPPKKFHMPDGVRKGFVKASKVGDNGTNDDTESDGEAQPQQQIESPEPLPLLSDVLLSSAAQRELECRYLDVQGNGPEFVEHPTLDRFSDLQRHLRPTKISHGRTSERLVGMLNSMHSFAEGAGKDYERFLHPADREEVLLQVEQRASFFTLSVPFQSNARPLKGDGLDVVTAGMPSAPISQCSSAGFESTLVDIRNNPCRTMVAQAPNASRGESFLSSPSPKASTAQSVYQPARKSRRQASNSGDDLPDFDTLIERPSVTSPENPVGKTREAALERPQPRKSRKVILDDDSDEE
ncbi:MAG: hypothetical protein Q9201_001544 [Fulgogasparrea decipioides]